MKIVESLNILIVDKTREEVEELIEILDIYRDYNGNSFVNEVYFKGTLEGGESIVENTEIDAIFIDPLNLDLERASKFIFSIRRRLPNIIFVLYANSDNIKENENEYYEGQRSRFHHYFRLNKKSHSEKLKNKLYHVLHLCMAEIRLCTYHSKISNKKVIPPDEIKHSLLDYNERFRNKERTAFVVMRFESSQPHRDIYEAIKKTLLKHDIFAFRADEYEFNTGLLENILTCIHGCDMGIAVYDRVSCDEFNPNVSFEVGYMTALQKPLCILKDKNLKALQTDLMGKLYNEFDIYNTSNSIDNALSKWIGKKAFP